MKVAVKTNRRTVGALAIAILVAVGIAWFLVGPGEAPAGQAPLVIVDQTSLEVLRAEFNRDSSNVRVIVLLSPT